MLADDYKDEYTRKETEHSLPKKSLLKRILESLEKTPKYFFEALHTHPNKNDLNEDGLTQVFITQNHVQILKLEIPIHVSAQYIDTYRKSKGKPDIHYTQSEEGKNYEPTFVMEAKRLPPPEKHREKEYICGTTQSGNPNGGIERFKLEKHGKGLQECGLLGYIESETPKKWLKKINKWISDLQWSKEECLQFNSEDNFLSRYTSKCIRNHDSLVLHHFWLYESTNSKQS